MCEAASISLNRNTVPGDASALSPGGVRMGPPAMTTRGCTTEDFKRIADFLDRCASIALDIQKEKGKESVPSLSSPSVRPKMNVVEYLAATIGFSRLSISNHMGTRSIAVKMFRSTCSLHERASSTSSP